MSTNTSGQNTPNSQGQHLTILRIKRKRDEEAPDVLFVDPSPKGLKRRRSGNGVFQLAETIDAKELESKEKEQDMTNRLAKLAKSSESVPPKASEQLKERAASPISRVSSTNSATRLYRVIRKLPQSTLKAPPKVLSSKDLAAKVPAVRILDAELAPTEEHEEVDPEMEKFQALLQDYLTMNEKVVETVPAPRANKAHDKVTNPTMSASTSSAMSTTSDDYVYDIFIHRTTALPEWAQSANTATIMGLPLSSDDEYDTDSESEAGDEADEDSNAEDYYKHDYPDEESDEEDSDFYESDDASDDDDDFLMNEFRWRN